MVVDAFEGASAPARAAVFGGAASRDAGEVSHGACLHGGGPAPARSPRLKRRHVVISAVALLVLVAIACLRFGPALYAWVTDPAAVHAFVDEHAVLSRLALVGVNVVQVVLAFLPGEPIELASGYAFGFWEGTVLCLVASAVGSSLVFAAVRRWGWSVVGLFFSRDRLERYAWLRDARRLELVMLVIFLVPGTPKDFLTYFAGLTRMRFPAMLAITTVGRIPSVITSTIAASALGAGNYAIAAASFVLAVVLAGAGMLACRRLEGTGKGRSDGRPR